MPKEKKGHRYRCRECDGEDEDDIRIRRVERGHCDSAIVIVDGDEWRGCDAQAVEAADVEVEEEEDEISDYDYWQKNK